MVRTSTPSFASLSNTNLSVNLALPLPRHSLSPTFSCSPPPKLIFHSPSLTRVIHLARSSPHAASNATRTARTRESTRRAHARVAHMHAPRLLAQAAPRHGDQLVHVARGAAHGPPRARRRT
eukprot:6172899-Pleurochrysis_carterae.AAC.1